MADVQVGDLIRVVPQMSLGANENINTFYFITVVNLTSSDAEFMTRLAVLFDDLYTIINPNVANALSYDVITAQNITQDLLLPAQSWPTLITGAAAQPLLPRQATLNVLFRTQRPRTRGLKQLGAYTEASNDSNGLVSAAPLLLAQQWGDALVLGLTDAEIDLQYGVWNAEFDRFTSVTSAQAGDVWGTRKSRYPGSGT